MWTDAYKVVLIIVIVQKKRKGKKASSDMHFSEGVLLVQHSHWEHRFVFIFYLGKSPCTPHLHFTPVTTDCSSFPSRDAQFPTAYGSTTKFVPTWRIMLESVTTWMNFPCNSQVAQSRMCLSEPAGSPGKHCLHQDAEMLLRVLPALGPSPV